MEVHWARKRRVPWLIARDIVKGLTDTAHYALGGYANERPDVSALEQQLEQRLPELDDEQRQKVADILDDGAQRIQTMLDKPSRSARAGADEALKAQERLQGAARSLLAARPAAAAATTAASPPATMRRKTTPGSTASSFAPKRNSAPGGHL